MAIEFSGFTADHRVSGRLPLADDRLSDMLNSVARVVIRDAVSESIDSGVQVTGDVLMSCGDLWLVAATGRRGLESRRRRTSTRRVRAGLGRYVVEGDLHVPAGRGRPVPGSSLDDLVNRSRIDWLETLGDEEAGPADPWADALIGAEPARTPAADPERAGWTRGLKGIVRR